MTDHLADMDEEIYSDADETDLTAVVDDHQLAEAEEKRETFWQRLSRMFSFSTGRGSTYIQRLGDLDESIALHPDVAANYVLRGELRLESGDFAGAQEDFQQGLLLAETQFEQDSWGFVDQLLQDRAKRGLELTRRKLHSGR